MPGAYSSDLRHRVLDACKAREGTRAEIALRYRISEATLYNWLKAEREDQRREPKPHGGGPARKLDEADEALIRQLAKEQNDRTLAEYCALILERTGKQVSDSTMCVVLGRLQLPRKKNAASQRAGPARDPGRARGVLEGGRLDSDRAAGLSG